MRGARAGHHLSQGAGPPWQRILTEMHASVDRGVTAALRREQKRRRMPPACREGCAACCRVNRDIPVYPLELAGISRFCVEILAEPDREALRLRLARHAKGDPCPFLAGERCVVHPVRPMACRLFNVFGTPCAPGEDAYHARRGDVLEIPQDLLDRAYRLMLPFHGVTLPEDQERWIGHRLVHTLVRNLPELEWASLARLMSGR